MNDDSDDDLFGEIDKAIALKRQEFIKKGLIKPRPKKPKPEIEVADELEPEEVVDLEEIEGLHGLGETSDFSNSFDFDFGGFGKTKARIVEPKFKMSLAELLGAPVANFFNHTIRFPASPSRRMTIQISTSSSEVIGSIDDFLQQILLRLPVKSLMRFKLVSKKWKSLITSTCFSIQYNSGPNPAVGMLYHGRIIYALEYIHLNDEHPTSSPFKELKFPEEPYPFWIHHYCNGLLLCCSTGNFDLVCRYFMSPIRRCYVYNPTTNCFTKLPRPGVANGVPRVVRGVTLAFDVAKSPPYKVVCVRGSEFAPDLSQIEIYSTESGEWRESGEPFDAKVDFGKGVYWNGSVHWIRNDAREVLFFDVDQERFGNMPLPDDLPNGLRLRKVEYFGESYDHLHLVQRYDRGMKLIVYEMKRDMPHWFAKYQVDLTAFVSKIYKDWFAFPERTSFERYTSRVSNNFKILLLVRGKEGAFLVMKILRTLVKFDLECRTFEVICEFRGDDGIRHPSRAFEYIESLRMFSVPTSCG